MLVSRCTNTSTRDLSSWSSSLEEPTGDKRGMCTCMYTYYMILVSLILGLAQDLSFVVKKMCTEGLMQDLLFSLLLGALVPHLLHLKFFCCTACTYLLSTFNCCSARIPFMQCLFSVGGM